VPIIILTMATILLTLIGMILEQHILVVQFLVITMACGISIYVLISLPNKVSEYTAKRLEYLDSKLDESIETTKGCEKDISILRSRVDTLCAEVLEGTEKRMSWKYFWETTERLKERIEADKAFHPNVVLSVGRSGAIVGGLLAGNMGGLLHLGIDRINKWSKDGSSRYVEILPPPETLESVLKGRNVLCVMSECDSGRTLEAFEKEIQAIKDIGTVKTAVLFRNRGTFYCPSYIAREDRGERPDFPFRTESWPRTSKGPTKEITA
jgi:hypoxanthine phosphoribosyltransferase